MIGKFDIAGIFNTNPVQYQLIKIKYKFFSCSKEAATITPKVTTVREIKRNWGEPLVFTSVATEFFKTDGATTAACGIKDWFIRYSKRNNDISDRIPAAEDVA